MSIEAASPAKNPFLPATRQQQKAWLALRPSPLWVCFLLALIVRAWLVVHTHGVIDADEATLGIQAQHILRGEVPIYYYGQPYMGSLEAYLMALLFAIAGSSVWTLRAEPTLLSLLLVWLTWKLGAALAEAAHLPPYAQRRFMTLAALFAALPPLYDCVIELRTLGGYIETFVIMLWLLLSALRLTRRWQAGATSLELAWRWAGIGFLIGLGFWVDPLVISAVLAAAVWIAGYCVVVACHGSFEKEEPGDRKGSPLHFILQFRRPLLSLLKGLGLAVAAIPAGLIGFAPALYWGAGHNWMNITYITKNSGSLSMHRLPAIRGVLQLYQACIAPRIIGGALPAVNLTSNSPGLFNVGLGVGLFCLLATVIPLGLSLFWPHPLLLRMRHLGGLPLLFAACTAFIFCVSNISTFGLFAPCSKVDLVGRYASPLLLALPFFFAAPFTIISMRLRSKDRRQLQNADDTHRHSQRNLAGASPSQVLQLFSKGAQVVLFALLLAFFCVQGYTYAQTNAGYTFQTSGCMIAPANNDPIIAYMQFRHIHYAWATFWIGNPIIFKTGERIIVTDPREVTIPHTFKSRIAGYTSAVYHAHLPSVLILIHQSDLHPLLLKDLHTEHIQYYAARFLSEPGVDLLIVTPLNRNISPFTADSLGTWFGGC